MLFEMFQYDFITRSFEAGILLSIIAPVLGVFLVVRRYSLLADALSHVSLLGVSLGFLLHINPLFTALATSGVAALGIETLRQNRKMFGESILAVFLSGSLAIAVVLIGIAKGFNVNLLNYLFGSLVTVQSSDIWLIAILAVVVLIFCTFYYRSLFLLALDEDLARVSGVPTRMLNNMLVMLSAFTVVVAMQMVGVLLVGALMVLPVLASMQVARSFFQIFLYAIFFSVMAVITGITLSYYLSIATGGAIVLVALSFFFLSLLFAKK